jgi:hypothetical protein
VGGLLALVPDLAAMAIDHVAQVSGLVSLPTVHRLQFPGVERLGGHRGARPDQVHEHHLAIGIEAQAQFADLVVVLQARSEKGDGLDQREAVDPHPQAGVLLLVLDRQLELVLDAARRRRQDVDRQHILQRPACLQRVGKAVHGRVEARAHGRGFVGNHAHETLAHLGFHFRGIQQGLDGGPDVAQAARLPSVRVARPGRARPRARNCA